MVLEATQGASSACPVALRPDKGIQATLVPVTYLVVLSDPVGACFLFVAHSNNNRNTVSNDMPFAVLHTPAKHSNSCHMCMCVREQFSSCTFALLQSRV